MKTRTSPVAAAHGKCSDEKCRWTALAGRRLLLLLDCAGTDGCLVTAHDSPHRRVDHLCGVTYWLCVSIVWRPSIALVQRLKREKGAAVRGESVFFGFLTLASAHCLPSEIAGARQLWYPLMVIFVGGWAMTMLSVPIVHEKPSVDGLLHGAPL